LLITEREARELRKAVGIQDNIGEQQDKETQAVKWQIIKSKKG